MKIQSSFSIQESPEQIGIDIGKYYNDIKNGRSFSLDSIIDSKSSSGDHISLSYQNIYQMIYI